MLSLSLTSRFLTSNAFLLAVPVPYQARLDRNCGSSRLRLRNKKSANSAHLQQAADNLDIRIADPQMPTHPAVASPRPSDPSNDQQGWESLTTCPQSPASLYAYPRYRPPTTLYMPQTPLPESHPSYQPYNIIPQSGFAPALHLHRSQRSFSSLASITPTPSPPPLDYLMSEMSDDEPSRSRSEDWRTIEDKAERRKIQNRNAQRKHSESPLPLQSQYIYKASSRQEAKAILAWQGRKA